MKSFEVNNMEMKIDGLSMGQVLEYHVGESAHEEKLTVTIVFDVDVVDVDVQIPGVKKEDDIEADLENLVEVDTANMNEQDSAEEEAVENVLE